MAKMEFQPSRQGAPDSGLTSTLLSLMGGSNVNAAVANVQATLDRRAQQEATSARLAQDREEFLYRVANDDVQRQLAENRFALDLFTTQQNLQNDQTRLDIARRGEERADRADQRAARADQRAAEAEERAIEEHKASMLKSGLEAARMKEAATEQDERTRFDGELVAMLQRGARTDQLIPAMASPVYGGLFRQPGMLDPSGAPTQKLREAMARIIRSRGFPGEDEAVNAAVDGLLTPRTYRSLDLELDSPHSLEAIVQAGALAGLSPKDVRERLKALDPEVNFGAAELERRMIDDSAMFGKFVATVDEQTGRALNLRLDELRQTAAALDGTPVSLNESSLADLDTRQLPADVRQAWADVGFNVDQLKDKSFWNAFKGPVVVNPATGEIGVTTDADMKLFNRVRPALEKTVQAAPWLLGQLQAIGGAQAQKTTQTQRNQVRLMQPKRPASAGTNPAGGAAAQNNAINGERASEEQFIFQNMPWLLQDFMQGLGLPEGYDPNK